MAYIIVVNPAILSDAMGKEWIGGLVVATCVSAAVATALMGWWADYPIALAPGMGLNAYFAYTVVLQNHVPWQIGLAAVFVSGILFVGLTFAGVQELLVTAVPRGIRNGTAAGIGIFISFIGLQKCGLVVGSPATLVTGGDATSAPALLALGGLVITGALSFRKVGGAIIIGIVCTAGAGMLFGVSPLPTMWFAVPNFPAGLVGQAILRIPDALELGLITIIVTFLFIDLFDTAGTLSGVGSVAGFMDNQDRLPRAKRAFLADGIGTSVGAIMGTSTVTSYIESAAGIAQGARTGLANYITAALFLLCIPFFPLAAALPGYATAPALVVVGVMMCGQMRFVDWDDMTEALPAVVVMIGIPLTFSIAEGLSLALVLHPLILALAGRWQQVHWLNWLLAGLVVLRFALI
jgi:AGZA family xanthine/uracil permease-like MFS transporter